MIPHRHLAIAMAVFTVVSSRSLAGQEPAPVDHAHMAMGSPGWQFMQDGVVFAEFNRQGGPRGGKEFVVPNWWMGMASRQTSHGQITLTGMLSLEPATLGKDGYREIFQVGETIDDKPLIDHQHPHDFLMQLAAVWRIPITASTGFTLAGGPSGEPALGPVAFMHRPSAGENPLAPLSHHTLDSTHIAFGVITAAIDHGPWIVEASLFNGREPDENRWDFDFGRLDSVSARTWFRPNDRWEFQVSTGRLTDPEALAPGNVQRTTASASWFLRDADDFVAVTGAYGVNVTDHGTRQAVLAEMTKRWQRNSVFGRAEVVQVESSTLHGGVDEPTDADHSDTLGAFTLGGVRDVLRWRGFEGGFGGAVTVYAVPERLTTTHGEQPVSFQLFFRLRLPTGGSGRMWHMRMSQPIIGHAAHQMAPTP